MTTRKELDNRMEADSFLTSKGVLSPQQRSSSGDAASRELTKALKKARSSDLPLIWVRGQGWRLDTEGVLEALTASKSADKPR
jgi:hypothetical protein